MSKEIPFEKSFASHEKAKCYNIYRRLWHSPLASLLSSLLASLLTPALFIFVWCVVCGVVCFALHIL